MLYREKIKQPQPSVTSREKSTDTTFLQEQESPQGHREKIRLSQSPVNPKKKSTDNTSSLRNQESPHRRVECIKTKEEFHSLKNQWNELLDSSISQNPFMRWEWLYTWWDVFEGNNRLFILAVYDGLELVSIAPFYIKKCFKLVKRLGFLGEGEKKSDTIVTHYPDIIVSEKYRKLAVFEIVNYLKTDIKMESSFNFASFNLVKQDAVFHDVSKELASRLDIQRHVNGYQFMIPLPSDDEEYIASLSSSVRKQFRLKNNRLEKLGEIVLKSEDDLSKSLEEVERLHRARWKSISPTSVYDSDAFKLFHKKVSERFMGQDIFDIRTMSLNGKAIVASYNLKYKDACYSYLSGFKSEDDRRLSPMFVFDLLELKGLIKEGYKSFDLLVSEEKDCYKSKFGSQTLQCYKVIWLKYTPLSFLIKSIYTIKPYLSGVYRKLKGK